MRKEGTDAGPERAPEKKGEIKTPALKAFGRDLTEIARKGDMDPVIGRQSEIERVIQIGRCCTKNNPVLLGEAGVGKTAIVEGLAQESLPSGLARERPTAASAEQRGTRGQVAMDDAELNLPFHVVSENEVECGRRALVQRHGIHLGDPLGLHSQVGGRGLGEIRVARPVHGHAALGNPHRPAGRTVRKSA